MKIKHYMVHLVLLCGLLPCATTADISKHKEFSQVEFASLDGKTDIQGYVLEAGGDNSSHWAIFTHACSGLLNKKGRIKGKYRALASHLQQHGISSLLVDSHSPRGKNNICRIPGRERNVKRKTRMQDILGASTYLKNNTSNSQIKIALIGWGQGALDSLNSSNGMVARSDKSITAAAMFYPPCRKGGGKSPFAPYAPILIVVGEDDNWEPVSYCEHLANNKKLGSAAVEIITYPDTHHGFDARNKPIREKRNARGTATTGSNPESTKDAYERITEFLSKYLVSN